MKKTTMLDDTHTFEEFGFVPLFAQMQPRTGEISLNRQTIPGRSGSWYFGSEIGEKEFEIPLVMIESDDEMKEEKIEKLINFFVDSKGKPRLVKIAFRRAPKKFVWARFVGTSQPNYSDQTVDLALNFTQTDPHKYGLSSMYDPELPLNYDEGHSYGISGYPNTKQFTWNIVPNHYSAIENYGHLETPIKITIQGTIRGGVIKHLATGKMLKLPNITNGRIIVDTEFYNINVNGVDILEFEGEFADLVSGSNGYLFQAESANANVKFDWLHRFV